MDKIRILWADDEIDLLKPHVLFLEKKGYEVETSTNGADAYDMLVENNYDIVFLDENMPGLTGLETLSKMKEYKMSIPIVMITKSEEEYIMEDAIGSKISDYLIKPVNPNQILLSIKKNLDTTRLVSEKTTSNYQQQFRELSMRLNDRLDYEEWMDVYKKMVYWEQELEKSEDEGMSEILAMQKREANGNFFRFIKDNYTDWLANEDDAPIQSHTLFKKKVAPLLEKEPVLLVVIDNLRLDQWKAIEPIISPYFNVEEEELYYSILPTATSYARNAFFSGMLPSDMGKMFPQWWKNEEEEGGKNLHERDFLGKQLERLGLDPKFSYHKILNMNEGKKFANKVSNLTDYPLNVLVYNFVDMLSHAKTEMEVIKELADDESAYRSLTVSWFKHSPLFDALKKAAALKRRVIITTDHGSVLVNNPVKVVGDKNTNSNLRYKTGRALTYNSKEVFEIVHPEKGFLPKGNVSSRYIFAGETDFFAYPNNYNHYVKYYRNTFQHGGVSLEEVLVPFISLNPK